MKKGIYLAVSAYLFWGVHPIYWKLLKNVPAIEIVTNRVIWSLLFFITIAFFNRDLKSLLSKVRGINNKWIIFFPASLIGSNWIIYVWAVNAGFIIETSLGYFIAPLVIIFLGVVILKEKLSTIKWIAISFAILGVLTMTFIYGQFPWISILLACTWGLYGLLRKKSPLSSIEGLTIEAGILSIPAIIYFLYLFLTGNSNFSTNIQTTFLLIGTGIISGLPLLIFITAARLIPFTVIGLLQYIYPTSLLLIGIFLYNETLGESKIIGFTFIWIGLFVYSFENLFIKRNLKELVSTISQMWNR
jgi:chloramphenicol-sensitive protein RarD